MAERIVILTGAGVSAESGLGTFRDKDGLWTKVDLTEVATPGGFRRNPQKVRDFYNARRTNLTGAQPNAAHRALARLEQALPGRVTLITQNVDDLHEKGGSRQVIHMHGRLLSTLCDGCGHRFADAGLLRAEDACPACAGLGLLRPDVVWFEEMPYHMEAIAEALAACDLFVSIGTSGTVYPAAGFVYEARRRGARTVELNLEPSDGETLFHERRYGPASVVVPEWVAELVES